MLRKWEGLRAESVAILAVLAVVAWRVWDFFRFLPAYWRAGYQFDYEEGNILNALVRISHHQTPYPDPHAFPSVFNTYGPVAYYAFYVPVRFFGLSFFAPRVVVFLCVLAIATLIGILLWRDTRSWLLGVTFGAMYLCFPLIQDWSFLVRVDFLAVTLGVIGLWLFLAHPSLRWLAATAFAAALLTKHSLLAPPAACITYLVLQRKFGEAVRIVAIIVVEFAAVIAVFLVITRGAIWTDLFRSHADPFSWSVYLTRMSALIAENRPVAALAGVYAICDLLRRRPSVPTLWLGFATFGSITAGKLGSGWNHFLEWPAAVCLCGGLGLYTLSNLPIRPVAFASTLTATAWLLWFTLQPQLRFDPFVPVESCGAAYAWVRNDAGPNVLSMNIGALVMGGKKIWVSNPFVLAQLAEHAGWSDAELTRMIHEGRFDQILTDVDYAAIAANRQLGVELFSGPALQFIHDDYVITRHFQCKDIGVVYEPKSRAAIQSRSR